MTWAWRPPPQPGSLLITHNSLRDHQSVFLLRTSLLWWNISLAQMSSYPLRRRKDVIDALRPGVRLWGQNIVNSLVPGRTVLTRVLLSRGDVVDLKKEAVLFRYRRSAETEGLRSDLGSVPVLNDFGTIGTKRRVPHVPPLIGWGGRHTGPAGCAGLGCRCWTVQVWSGSPPVQSQQGETQTSGGHSGVDKHASVPAH